MVIRAWMAYFVVASGTIAAAQGPSEAPPARSAGVETRIPSLICGTRVFRPDHSIDPTFSKAAPPGTFTLRTLRPEVCQDSSRTPMVELKQRLPQFLGPKR